MGQYNISKAASSDMTNIVEDVEIESRVQDNIKDQDETTYQNTQWYNQLGIYKTIPEFKIAVDMRAIWTLGDKIDSTPEDKPVIEDITGFGKDNFRNILKNMIVTRRIGQDSYAEIIRDKNGNMINLKILDPFSIKQVYNRKGILIRYEQTTMNPTTKKTNTITFKPHEIFHLTNKRIADEIHGVADSEALQAIIEANKESFTDVRQLMHRHVRPLVKFTLDTDDETKINAFIAKYDQIVNKGENLFIPKDTVQHEIIAVPANATLNPMPWREHLKNYFYQVVGMPQIIMGSSGEFTESTAKIAYLAFEQSVKDEQSDIVEQVRDQLNLTIILKFPASLRNELLTDESKDTGQLNTEMNTAGMEE